MAKKVMIVEDEAAIASLVALIVRGMGLEAVTAENGAEALVKLESFTPDMFIVDLIMPVMTGEELIQEIQGTPELADKPIVLLTTRHGAAGYKKDAFPLIAKPFDPDDIKAMVKQVLKLD